MAAIDPNLQFRLLKYTVKALSLLKHPKLLEVISKAQRKTRKVTAWCYCVCSDFLTKDVKAHLKQNNKATHGHAHKQPQKY